MLIREEFRGPPLEVFCAFPDALNFIDAILEHFDAATTSKEYPLGYISLRVCGSSAGLLAMEQAELGSSVAAIEVAMVTTPDTLNLVQWVESQVQPNRFLASGVRAVEFSRLSL